MSQPSKQRVRQSFERAAPTYDSAAHIQRRICAHLAAGLPNSLDAKLILDTGCGTGHALGLLRQQDNLAACGNCLRGSALTGRPASNLRSDYGFRPEMN